MLTAVLRSAARRPTIVPSTITSTQRRTVLTLSKTAATASGAGRNGDGRVWQRTESGAAVCPRIFIVLPWGPTACCQE
ncbi:OsmC domain-containing protein [Ceratobasidium sp. AG-Ba]|nr:OsmC domain-containing protein [Ceratobasidium sp. AG-Ba]